jgi:hypothetical protein
MPEQFLPSPSHLQTYPSARLFGYAPQHVPDAGLVIDDQDMERVSHPRAGIEPYRGKSEHVQPVTKRHGCTSHF